MKDQLDIALLGSKVSLALTQQDQEILEVLRRRGGDMWTLELLNICGASPEALARLEQLGCVKTSALSESEEKL